MSEVIFRIIRNVIPVAIIVALYFLGTDILDFLSVGQLEFALPIPEFILFIALAVYFVVETFVFGGPWAAAVYLIITILVLQNWLVAVIVGAISAGLRFGFAKMSG